MSRGMFVKIRREVGYADSVGLDAPWPTNQSCRTCGFTSVPSSPFQLIRWAGENGEDWSGNIFPRPQSPLQLFCDFPDRSPIANPQLGACKGAKCVRMARVDCQQLLIASDRLGEAAETAQDMAP